MEYTAIMRCGERYSAETCRGTSQMSAMRALADSHDDPHNTTVVCVMTGSGAVIPNEPYGVLLAEFGTPPEES